MTALTLDAVSARYPGPWGRVGPTVCRDITMQIEDGERVALVGSSGSGKSTLARLAAGLLRPSFGRVRIFGADTTAWSRTQWRRSRVQLLPQSPGALMVPGVPIRLALEESALLHRTPRTSVDEVADVLEIRHRLDSPPETLSGGELRRAAMGRVLLASPRLLIADEATTGLDLPLAARLLRRLKHELGAACAQVYITHDLRRYRTLCDRVIVVHEGTIVDVLDAKAPAPSSDAAATLLRASGWSL